jgi:DNA-binding NarL/FixJ family response regulator
MMAIPAGLHSIRVVCPDGIAATTKITIDGEPLNGVTALRFEASIKGGPVRLTLSMDAYVEIAGNTEVTYTREFGPLSPREVQILLAVATGQTNSQVAYAKGISEQTVKNHMSKIMVKLNVTDRTQAVVYAISQGWFDGNAA